MDTATIPRLAELRAAVTAIRDLPELLEPYTVVGTKLRLPNELGDLLAQDALNATARGLSSVHYEGVKYDYQDEAKQRDEGGTNRDDGSIALADALGDLKALGDLLLTAANSGDTMLDGTIERAGAMIVERAIEANRAWARFSEGGAS